MKPNTIFFDYGGTLAYMDPRPEQIFLRLLDEQEFDADPEVLKDGFRNANDVTSHLNICDYHGRMREFWNLYNGVILKRLGIADPKGDLSNTINAGFKRADWYHLFPDVRETLETLRANGYGLGIISNNVDDMLEHMKILELTHYFDTATYSQEARADKPDPAIFRVALKRAGCAPEEAVHVGDSYEADIVGARTIGITPVLVDRNGQYPNADCLRATDLRQVSELVHAIGNRSAGAKILWSRRGGS